jgi:predicted enzyme related to lactoylglutathione lyase
VNDVTIARAFVAAGLGVALLPELALSPPHDDVVVRPVRDIQPFRSLYGTWLRRRSVPAVQHMVRYLADAATARLSGARRRFVAGRISGGPSRAEAMVTGDRDPDQPEGAAGVIAGVQKLIVEVEDQDRALRFWTDAMKFELAQDVSYGGARWLEVRTPDDNTVLVLAPRQDEPPIGPEELPTSNIFFYCDDLPRTYDELRSRGVEFPQPPVEQSFGWWSMFQDNEGNRFALQPREG